jgi:hypothetical protein
MSSVELVVQVDLFSRIDYIDVRHRLIRYNRFSIDYMARETNSRSLYLQKIDRAHSFVNVVWRVAWCRSQSERRD